MDGLNVSGLIVSTLSAAVLLGQDIKERRQRTNRQQKFAYATTHLETLEKNLVEHVASLQAINRQLGLPENDKVDERTESDKRYITEARANLRKLTDPHQIVLDEMTPLSHLLGYALLVLGFGLQLAAASR